MRTRATTIAYIAAALLAGCGSSAPRRVIAPKPKLPHALAAELAALSDAVAQKLDAGNSCGALTAAEQLRSQALAAIASGRVRRKLRQPLAAATTRLQAQITCIAPPAPPSHGHRGEHDHGKHKGHGGEGD